MKTFFIILDGLGDKPYEKIGGTPLEAAYTPNMDKLAEKGRTGMLVPIREDIAPESDQAMLALLGYDPFEVYTGRGPLEAYGAGADFGKGEVVFRGNFAVEGDVEAEVSKEEGRKLCEKLDKNIPEARFIHTVGHRFVMILRGNDEVSNTHPGYKRVDGYVTSALPFRKGSKKSRPLSGKGKHTAKVVNDITKKTNKILDNRIILLRGAGTKLPDLKPLKGKWCLLADMPVEKGIGKLAGMDILEKENKPQKQILKNLDKYDNFYIEIKSPDKFAHRKNVEGKRRSIEKIDKEFLGMLDSIEEPFSMVITGDHSTLSSLGAHTSDPVPFLVYGRGRDKVKKFGEKYCRKGELGKVLGKKVFDIVFG